MSDLDDLLKRFEQLLEAPAGATAGDGKEQAEKLLEQAKKIFPRYSEYEAAIQGRRVPERVAREFDDIMDRMIRETWQEVASRTGHVQTVVPIGSYGDRTGPRYRLGSSDKDMMPLGRDPRAAAEEFSAAFARRYKLSASSLHIYALDPSDASSLPGRIRASWHPETYRTAGGLKAMEHELWRSNPKVWNLGGSAPGEPIAEVLYRNLPGRGQPLALTADDALGYFTDNTRFRTLLRQQLLNDTEQVFTHAKQIGAEAKYNLRNFAAWELAGEALTPRQHAAKTVLEGLRDGTPLKTLLAKYGQTTNQSGRLAQALAKDLDAFTETAARALAAKHLTLIQQAGQLSRAGLLLREELAGAIANLRSDARLLAAANNATAGSAASKAIWKKAQDSADRMATGARRVFGQRYFDMKAKELYSVSYDKLTPPQRLQLHGGVEPPPGMWSRFSRAGAHAGILLTIAGMVLSTADAYGNELQSSDSRIRAIGAGSVRLGVDLLWVGWPPGVLLELLGHGTAAMVQYGIAEHRAAGLETLFERYRRGVRIDDLLNADAVAPGLASVLRGIQTDIRADWERAGLTISEAMLAAAVEDFVRRYLTEREAVVKIQELLNDADQWVKHELIALVPGGRYADNDTLSRDEYQRRLGVVVAQWQALVRRLRRDGMPQAEKTAWTLLKTRFNHPDAYQSALDDLYRLLLGRLPDSRRAHIIAVGRGARRHRARPPAATRKLRPGAALLASGGRFEEQPVDAPCQPAVRLGPVDLPSAGRLRANIVGKPPVPARWSGHNTNTSLSLDWERRRGGGWESAGQLLRLSGQMQDHDLTGEAGWDGPGRLWATLGPPCGSGPLTGSCFEQTYTLTVTLLAWEPDNRPGVGEALDWGDVLHAGDSADTALLLPDGSRVTLKPNSRVRLAEPGKGRVRIIVERGGIRFERPPHGPHVAEVQVGDRILIPRGTAFDCETDDQGAFKLVRVHEGSVQLRGPAGAPLELHAGQGLQLPEGAVVDLPAAPAGPALVGGLPVAALLVGTPAPVAPAAYPLRLGIDGLPDGDWLWQDPGADVPLEPIQPDLLRLIVGASNDLSGHGQGGPRLLHPVTGDFDLTVELRLQTRCTDEARFEFLLYAPGSCIGLLAGQFQDGTPLVDCRTLAAACQVPDGRRLALHETKLADCPPVPDEFVMYRLSRRADLWRSLWSVDGGTTWNLAARTTVSVPPALWVGMGFGRTARDRLDHEPAIFDLRAAELQVYPAGEATPLPWDLAIGAGTATATARGARLQLSPGQAGNARAWLPTALTGDFDVVCRIETDPWPDGPAPARAVLLSAADDSGRNLVYIGYQVTPRDAVRLTTDMMVNGGWNRYQWRSGAAVSPLFRLCRRAGRIETHWFFEGRWNRLDRFTDGFDGPAWLGISLSDDSAAPVAARVDCRIEHLAIGKSAGQTWLPAERNAFAVLPRPAGIKLPRGTQVQVLCAPYPLTGPVHGEDGVLWVFASQRDVARVYRVNPDGQASIWSESPLIGGVVRRRAVPSGKDLIVGIDYWSDGGNPNGGLFNLRANGTYKGWALRQGHGGIGDVLRARDGAIVFADFENDNIWRVKGPTAEETPLLHGDIPNGIIALAWHPGDGELWFVNLGGDWPFGGVSALYRVIANGEHERVWSAPDGANISDLAASPGGVLPAGLYFCISGDSAIYRLEHNGTAKAVVKGLPAPAELSFSPDGTNLSVVCANGLLLRLTGAAATAAPTKMPQPGAKSAAAAVATKPSNKPKSAAAGAASRPPAKPKPKPAPKSAAAGAASKLTAKPKPKPAPKSAAAGAASRPPAKPKPKPAPKSAAAGATSKPPRKPKSSKAPTAARTIRKSRRSGPEQQS